MTESSKKRDFAWRRKLSQEFVLNVVRNRKGHRPVGANSANGDLLIASYNVHKCVGTDKIFDPERIVRVIREISPDVLALQEADKRFGERYGLINLDHLQQETGLTHVPIKTTSSQGLGWHGNALFIRNGLVSKVTQVKLPGVEPRGALIAELEFANGPLRVIAAHFGLLRSSRRQQAKTILKLLMNHALMPTIMTGDLNEWRIGKSSALADLKPYFDVTLGTVPSFPSRFPVLALDRVFAFPSDLVSSIETHSSPLSRVASDHLPIKARIDLVKATATLGKVSPSDRKAGQAIHR